VLVFPLPRQRGCPSRGTRHRWWCSDGMGARGA